MKLSNVHRWKFLLECQCQNKETRQKWSRHNVQIDIINCTDAKEGGLAYLRFWYKCSADSSISLKVCGHVTNTDVLLNSDIQHK